MLYLVALLGWLVAGCSRPDGPEKARVRIGSNVWTVRLALDEATRHKGLSNVKDLPEGTGMLFAFPREEVLHFYMRGCYVPLDVAFISSKHQIVHIRTMPVEPDRDNPKCFYSSKHPCRYALEVPAGALARAKVSVGDRVELLGPAGNASKDAR